MIGKKKVITLLMLIAISDFEQSSPLMCYVNIYYDIL